VTPRGRELILGKPLANPDEHEVSFFHSGELHPAKSNSRAAAGIIGKHDLVRRQRHSEPVGKVHERARWTVADDRKHRDPVALLHERRGRCEVDEQGKVGRGYVSVGWARFASGL